MVGSSLRDRVDDFRAAPRHEMHRKPVHVQQRNLTKMKEKNLVHAKVYVTKKNLLGMWLIHYQASNTEGICFEV